ncbi:MAG: YidC/Oxa1 family membrane protein insertase [Patescibacteria group bacterium]
MKALLKAVLYTPLFNLLVFFSWLVPGHSIGWAIILLTIVVRTIIWVPNSKMLKSQLYMRSHQDELKKLNEKYDNPQERAKAQMAYYKEHGINPMAGCLPMLIQLPILYILYFVLIAGLKDIRPDLLYSFTPHIDAVNAQFLGINLAGKDRFFLPVLAALLQFAQTRFNQKLTPISAAKNDPAAMMTKQMMYLFPAMTYFIGSTLPAGLSLYWATATLFQIGQQAYITKKFVAKPSKGVEVTVRKK